MAEGNVANSNGMVMGKAVMGLSTLLLSRNVVVVMPKKSRTSVLVLLCKKRNSDVKYSHAKLLPVPSLVVEGRQKNRFWR